MKLIKIKSNGAEVRILQELLKLNGFDVKVDGDFGKNTEKAVKEFQKQYLGVDGSILKSDGIVGPATWAALMNYELQPEKPDPSIKEDSYTLKKINLIHPKLRAELLQIYREILTRGVKIRITDTLRTFEEQDKLYAQGRTAPGARVTNAKAGQSYHNYGLAVDFSLLLRGGKKVSWNMNLDLDNDSLKDWNEVVAVFKHYGWDWGGNWTSFKDYPHFEKTFGFTTKQLLDRYNSNQLEDGYVKIN